MSLGLWNAVVPSNYAITSETVSSEAGMSGEGKEEFEVEEYH